jgi:hypothetical protein
VLVLVLVLMLLAVIMMMGPSLATATVWCGPVLLCVQRTTSTWVTMMLAPRSSPL